ncbi:hypothetical protein AVEN_158579-1 [Araneus ventricosus]|uniref:Endonuclease/exonuclease/phosphatase domain-containing protein n=1 Tax=Araneus ventricosus TaxID=182803 RepID=A0A4Y2JQ55_ARAVE|nr:hypothetical protein AVEN_158579-1 [Araneus ventricosus]
MCFSLPPPPIIEATFVKIFIPTTQETFNIVSTYIPPGSDSSFTIDIEALVQFNYSTILIGDINAKHKLWNCENHNKVGITLDRFARQLKLQVIATDHPTRYSKKGSSIIHFALARNIKYSAQIKNLYGSPQ